MMMMMMMMMMVVMMILTYIVRVLNKKTKGVVFILWGGFAQKKGKIIDTNKHFVIQAAHPSPLSAVKFHGCKVFSKAYPSEEEGRGMEER